MCHCHCPCRNTSDTRNKRCHGPQHAHNWHGQLHEHVPRTSLRDAVAGAQPDIPSCVGLQTRSHLHHDFRSHFFDLGGLMYMFGTPRFGTSRGVISLRGVTRAWCVCEENSSGCGDGLFRLLFRDPPPWKALSLAPFCFFFKRN